MTHANTTIEHLGTEATDLDLDAYLLARAIRHAQILVTERSAEKPNAFGQTIKDIEPGRLYSLRMITTDYGELVAGKSREQKHGVYVKIAGAEMLPDKRFQYVYPHRRNVETFTMANKAWMNFHWLVFRAKGTEAELAISDWTEDGKPAGPAGQRIAFNFIQIQPYDAEE